MVVNHFHIIYGFCAFLLYGEDSQDYLLYILQVLLNILKNIQPTSSSSMVQNVCGPNIKTPMVL